ncbi:hypothetical protein N9L68_01085 [bacterium]|nr:hypothetical protein [bacterium]
MIRIRFFFLFMIIIISMCGIVVVAVVAAVAADVDVVVVPSYVAIYPRHGPAECAARLNPPPPSGGRGVLNRNGN